jgi:hypothetical protein
MKRGLGAVGLAKAAAHRARCVRSVTNPNPSLAKVPKAAKEPANRPIPIIMPLITRMQADGTFETFASFARNPQWNQASVSIPGTTPGLLFARMAVCFQAPRDFGGRCTS